MCVRTFLAFSAAACSFSTALTLSLTLVPVCVCVCVCEWVRTVECGESSSNKRYTGHVYGLHIIQFNDRLVNLSHEELSV